MSWAEETDCPPRFYFPAHCRPATSRWPSAQGLCIRWDMDYLSAAETRGGVMHIASGQRWPESRQPPPCPSHLLARFRGLQSYRIAGHEKKEIWPPSQLPRTSTLSCLQDEDPKGACEILRSGTEHVHTGFAVGQEIQWGPFIRHGAAAPPDTEEQTGLRAAGTTLHVRIPRSRMLSVMKRMIQWRKQG